MENSTRLKVAVIGGGRMGELHLKKYVEMPNVEFIGVYETNSVRAQYLRDLYGVNVFNSLGELFFESDAVSICSPTASHYSLARQALETGIHVLVEKPMTETVQEAEQLNRIAKENKLVLAVGFIERFRYQALSKGFPLTPLRFLEIHRLSSTLNREPSVDVVSDLMIHDLDLALSLMGEPSYISAIGVPVITPYYDIANVRLEFSSGAIATLSASRVSPTTTRRIRAFSASTYASMDLVTNTVSIKNRSSMGQLESHLLPPAALDSLNAQCSHFVDCIGAGTRPLVNGEDGCLALKYALRVRTEIEKRNMQMVSFFGEKVSHESTGHELN